MNILLTGAMGFIGSNLAIDLLNAGHNILALDNLSKPSINPTDRIKSATKDNWWNFKFYKCDISDAQHTSSIIAAHGNIDAIIHLAATGSVPLSFHNPMVTMQNNVMGFTSMLDICRSFKIKKFIYASSSSVYGDSKINPRKEGSEGFCLSPYSLSKEMNEKLAILLTPNDTVSIGLRFFNVYGPGQPLYGSYSAVIPRFITEEKPQVYGNGENKRDFTFVGDVSSAIMKCLDHNKSTILNIGTGVKTSLNQLLDLLKKKDVAEYKEQRVGDVVESFADISLANKMINYKPFVNLELGLKITKEYYDAIAKEIDLV